MKKIFIKDIQAECDVRDYFLVRQKDISKGKTNKPYLSLKLCDKTGEIDARVWDNVDYLSSLFEKGDIIFINKGSASVYQKNVQISIGDLKKGEKSELDMADFIETSKFPIDEMLKELKGYVKNIKNSHLKKLLDMFFEDNAFVKAFCNSPAAKSVHHAFLGGLLEHTLSVTRLVTLLAKNYPELNEEILITGAILHDIGKTEEIKSDLNFEYTNDGRLLGHLVIGTLMLEKKIEQIKGFPPNLATLLKHIIISHHGAYEWGSPKKPKTLEAFVLHHADDLDAKIMMIKAALKREVGNRESGWTNYNQLLERYLFKEDFNSGNAEMEESQQKEENKEKKSNGKNQFSMFE